MIIIIIIIISEGDKVRLERIMMRTQPLVKEMCRNAMK